MAINLSQKAIRIKLQVGYTIKNWIAALWFHLSFSRVTNILVSVPLRDIWHLAHFVFLEVSSYHLFHPPVLIPLCKAAMSISLTNLPPELLTRIVANVESQATLYNLARSSRQLYFFTIPHLYQHITIQEEGEQQNGQLRNLTSLLIRKPDLAGLVRHFTLHTVNSEYACSDDSESSGDSEYFGDECFGNLEYSKILEEFDEVNQALKIAVSAWNLSEEEEDDWLRQLSRTHDSVLALLLPALLKVEKVVLDLNIGHDTPYLEWMIGRAVRKEKPFDIQSPPFEALTVFVCPHNQFNKKKHSISFLASLLKLPAIREISGGFECKRNDLLCRIRSCDKNPIKIYRSSSSLTSLDLAAYAVSPGALNLVLRGPKALKTFIYTICLPSKYKYALIDFRCQETHLESFSLNYDESCEKFYAVGPVPDLHKEDYFSPIKSFISFNSLRVFKIAVVFLFTTEYGIKRDKFINFFPPSLEVLHLTRVQGRFEGLLEAVAHLLASKSSQHIFSLNRLILEEAIQYEYWRRKAKLMEVMWKGTQETAMERLSSLAAAQGVSFDVIEAPTIEEFYPM